MMVDAPYTGAFVRIDSIYQPGVPIGAVARPAERRQERRAAGGTWAAQAVPGVSSWLSTWP